MTRARDNEGRTEEGRTQAILLLGHRRKEGDEASETQGQAASGPAGALDHLASPSHVGLYGGAAGEEPAANAET